MFDEKEHSGKASRPLAEFGIKLVIATQKSKQFFFKKIIVNLGKTNSWTEKTDNSSGSALISR